MSKVAVAAAARRARRRAYVEANGLPSHVRHGFSAYVNWGCRCNLCTEEHRKYQAART